MLDIEKLLNTYSESGNSIETFKKENSEIAENTKELCVRSGDVIFLSLCEIPKYQVEGKVSFYVLSDEYITDVLMNGSRFCVGTLDENEIGEELLEELKNTTGLMAVINGVKYLVSDLAIPTLTIRSGVGGDETIARQNLFRNLHFADAMIHRNAPIHFVYREGINLEGKEVRKILACFGSAYTYVPQTIMYDAVEEIVKDNILGDAPMRYWTISHEYTDIELEFPEMKEEFSKEYGINLMPGIFMCTSDIGKSSIIIRGIFYVGRSYVIIDEILIKHVGKISKKDILEKVHDEIFPKIRTYPEVFAKLIGEYAVNYEKIDLTTERGCEKNLKMISELNAKVMRSCFKGVIPLKKIKQLVECMNDEINSSIKYTLYDIALNFLSIPERVEGFDRLTLNEIKKAAAKVPAFLGKNLHENKKDDEIFLLPL